MSFWALLKAPEAHVGSAQTEKEANALEADHAAICSSQAQHQVHFSLQILRFHLAMSTVDRILVPLCRACLVRAEMKILIQVSSTFHLL